ncbi:regulator of protease activity HflC (stomatin/prohibitin superfamily) [Lipingzhangella halophila]|uniref:Regulator of protease activity HflC (Stomatin/prohibitin superfamily) n=1 Tax=Lipingzhangella halophila TaxID=1783352 RepID=A0A7W7RPS6_9ACTN|nr:SPFH domain-containing protein [Lipingzhangella halophila]MBB4935351.1 regulator of protease activity HflC (stomatin/prohibitin superfamily) [Lipingzhangella halophila]
MKTTNPTGTGIEMPEPKYRERTAFGMPGFGFALAELAVFAVGAALVVIGAVAGTIALVVLGALAALLAAIAFHGLTIVAPNEARVVQFLGRYIGTVRQDGLRWVLPLTTRTAVSTRIRNHETSVMKVNDADGNPIDIAAVVVWQVQDTARAVFEVDDFVQFVATQTEAGVRHIANRYPYDSYSSGNRSLRDNAEEITEQLSVELTERVASAGVRIVEARFSHLAYAQEIAQAMLQRQQAGAVVAARRQIVDGAVGMVDLALKRLSEEEVVELDEERKAAMVSNLLVVLCSDRPANPVVNTGTLYQ